MTGDVTKFNHCIICGSDLKTRFIVDNTARSRTYTIAQCEACAMALVEAGHEQFVDYSNYGDHIAAIDDKSFQSRSNKISSLKRLLFFLIKHKYGLKAKILDFGSGAGFFIKSCLHYGFSVVHGIEPSQKMREMAHTKLHIDSKCMFIDISTLNDHYDVVTMFDVIEHLSVDGFDSLMRTIVSQMKDGALLLGTTPNINSLNLRLFGDRDPVVAPPEHSMYFSQKALNTYLGKLGLQKLLLLSHGLSTNSFFRPHKFRASWVEQPIGIHKLASFIVRLLFRVAGIMLMPLGMGYEIYFVYRK